MEEKDDVFEGQVVENDSFISTDRVLAASISQVQQNANFEVQRLLAVAAEDRGLLEALRNGMCVFNIKTASWERPNKPMTDSDAS